DLPADLLDKIAGCLKTQSDLGRFRSVCRGWRSSAPPPPPLKASRVIRLPWLPICDEYDEPSYFGLKEFTVYSIEPLPSSTHNDGTPSAAAAARPWIVMLRFTKPGTAHLRDLADLSRVRKVDEGLPKALDLRDFQMGGGKWTEIRVTLEEDLHSYIVGYHKVGSSEDLFLVGRDNFEDGYEFSVSKLDEHKGDWVPVEGGLKDHISHFNLLMQLKKHDIVEAYKN
ncbi:hypothetical protein Tsubulata_022977, partial [Turnera subulata]